MSLLGRHVILRNGVLWLVKRRSIGVVRVWFGEHEGLRPLNLLVQLGGNVEQGATHQVTQLRPLRIRQAARVELGDQLITAEEIGVEWIRGGHGLSFPR